MIKVLSVMLALAALAPSAVTFAFAQNCPTSGDRAADGSRCGDRAADRRPGGK